MKQPLYTGLWGDHHIQGIAVDEQQGFIYYSFTTQLVKATLDGEIVGSVTGLLGHLGCIAFCQEDGCVYGSLEYKNDSIGKGILGGREIEDGFYIACFRTDAIDRLNIPAEGNPIMTCSYLSEVVRDYQGTGKNEAGETVPHRYGCSGIDGLTFGPLPGGSRDQRYLYVAYGIYGDATRQDNDHQILLCYDPVDIRSSAKPLRQEAMHRSGPSEPIHKYFVYTGNTTFGVQNLEYDAHTHCFYMAVYPGEKPEYPNYSLFAVDAAAPAEKKPLRGLEEQREVLRLRQDGMSGWYFSYGSTGLCSLGGGSWLISHPKSTPEGQCGYIYRYRWDEVHPFAIEE